MSCVGVRVRRLIFWGAIAAAILAIALVAWMALNGYSCFLDLLNHFVIRGARFKPFYGGIPGLPPPADLVRGLDTLESLFPQIKAEAEALLPLVTDIPTMRDVYNHNFARKEDGAGLLSRAASRIIYGKHAGIFDKIQSPDWRTYNLLVFDQPVPGNAQRCPITMAALRGVQGVQSALFSFMLPWAYVPPHADPGKGVIRYHLALKVPQDRSKCFIQVEPDTRLSPHTDLVRYHWGEGAGVLFDDVFPHWVRNDTDEVRIVLFVDIKRPLDGVLAPALQGLADLANHYHPGVRRLLTASEVRSR